MIMSKKYTVYITKHLEPVTIEADSQENAEQYARSCIDLIDVQEIKVLAVGQYDSQPVEDIEVRNSKNKW
tara:strand:+ start:909 stop:1118 length:210 start_codon:yes stop_codon:yes gene_type:complete